MLQFLLLQVVHRLISLPALMCLQVSELQQNNVLTMISNGLKKGGTLHCGGGKPSDLKGYFLEPTVITDLDDEHELVQEEV